MSQEIREKREKIRADMQRLGELIEIERLKLRMLSIECRHENSFDTSHMGESCHHCPDCGDCNAYKKG